MDNFKKIEGAKNSIESKERLESFTIESLHRALLVHDTLGEAGEELVQRISSEKLR